MLIKNFPKELQKELKKRGIELTPETKFDVIGNELVIFGGDQIVKINDPKIVVAAKRVIDEEIFKKLDSLDLDRDTMREIIYALKVVYERDNRSFSEFCKNYTGKTDNKLKYDLTTLVKTYIKRRNLTPNEFGDEMLIGLMTRFIHNISSIPTELSYDRIPCTIQNLCDIIAKTSEKRKLSLEKLLGLYQI